MKELLVALLNNFFSIEEDTVIFEWITVSTKKLKVLSDEYIAATINTIELPVDDNAVSLLKKFGIFVFKWFIVSNLLNITQAPIKNIPDGSGFVWSMQALYFQQKICL